MTMCLASQSTRNSDAEMSTCDSKNTVHHIIHYKGQVTDVINVAVGIYILDKKIHLFLSTSALLVEKFSFNDHVLVTNVHILSANNQKFLVGCALSSIRKISEESVSSVEVENVKLLGEHKICFPDLFMRQHFINFNVYIVKQCLWNSFCCHHVEKNFGNTGHSYQENFRKWDRNFFKKPFDEAYPIPSLSFLISEAKSRIVWSKHSVTWDHATVNSNELYVLVGFLYLKENGNFELSDAHTTIPCIFSDDFDSISDSNSGLICGISSGSVGYYVALHKYCFVFERFSDDASLNTSYICASVTHLLLLERVSNMRKSSSCNSFQTSITQSAVEDRRGTLPQQNSKSSSLTLNNECADVSAITSLLKDKLSLSVSDRAIRKHKFVETKYVCIEVIVLAKCWSSEKGTVVFHRALVSLLSKKFVYVENQDFSLIAELSDSVKFGEMEGVGDDEDIIGLLTNLKLEQEIKYAMLNFVGSSSQTCSNLRPGHRYKIFIPFDFNSFSLKRRKKYLYNVVEGGSHMHFIDVDKNVRVLHSSKCFLDSKESEGLSDVDVETPSIKDVIANRNILNGNIIKGVLVDKSFEKDLSSQNNRTLRLVLKDVDTADCIPVYVFCYPKAFHGLLPGVEIEFIGCQCVASQKGYLYLRSSNSFGLHVSNMRRSSTNILFSNKLSSRNKDDTEIFMLKSLNFPSCVMTFKCLNGLVLKITYARIYFACMECFKCFEKKCTCGSEYMEMFEVDFDVDDGSNVVSMHGTGNVLRSLLMLTQNEWDALIKHVLETRQVLQYNFLEKSKIPKAFMSRLFYCLCTKSALNRPVCLTCSLQRISDGKNGLKYSCICHDLSEMCVQDIAAKYYVALTR